MGGAAELGICWKEGVAHELHLHIPLHTSSPPSSPFSSLSGSPFHPRIPLSHQMSPSQASPPARKRLALLGAFLTPSVLA